MKRGNDSMFPKQHAVHLLEGRKYEIKEKEVVKICCSAWMSLLMHRGQERSLLLLALALKEPYSFENTSMFGITQYLL